MLRSARRRWIAVLALGLAVSGCGTTQAPPRRRPCDAYPSARFMCAVGYGRDERSATEAARVELARSVSVHIVSEFRKIVQSRREDALVKNLTDVVEKTVSFTDNDLVGTRVAESWYDAAANEHGVALVLDRAAAGAVYARRVQSAVEEGERLHESSRSRHGQGLYPVALQDDLEALTHIQSAVRIQLAGMVVCPSGMQQSFYDMVRAPILAEIKDHLREMLHQISVEKVSGDGQRIHPGYGLKQPLVVRATAGDGEKAVGGLPLRFWFSEGKGELPGGAQTDARGEAVCRVERVEGGTGTVNTIVAELDLAFMTEQADLAHVTAPQATFTYYLPGRSNTYVAVYVDDEVASDAIMEGLSASGFLLVQESDVLKVATGHNLRSDADEAELLRVFSELQQVIGPQAFLFIVAGKVEPGEIAATETSAGTYYVAVADYSFRLLDASLPAEEKTVRVLTGDGTEAWTDNKEKAMRRARREAGRNACAEILKELSTRLSGS